MPSESQPAPLAEPAQMEEQLFLYARELHDLYQQEKKEREALAEEKLVLQYRVKELSALNHLFQRHLERRLQLEDVLKEVAAGLKGLLLTPSPKRVPRRQMEHLLARLEAALAPPARQQTRNA